MTKVCTKCEVEKSLEEFNRNAKSKDGHRRRCRLCESVRAIAYCATHRDEIKVRNVAYRATHIEQDKAYRAAYRATHKEEEKAHHTAYCAAHSETIKAYQAAYQAAHPDMYREHNHRRRARKQANGVFPVSLAAVRERDKMICHLCGKKVKPADLNFDHVIPINKGGPHAEWNLRVAHVHCNVVKHDKLIGQPYLPMVQGVERECAASRKQVREAIDTITKSEEGEAT